MYLMIALRNALSDRLHYALQLLRRGDDPALDQLQFGRYRGAQFFKGDTVAVDVAYCIGCLWVLADYVVFTDDRMK